MVELIETKTQLIVGIFITFPSSAFDELPEKHKSWRETIELYIISKDSSMAGKVFISCRKRFQLNWVYLGFCLSLTPPIKALITIEFPLHID
jgi:hypothetical protein